MDDKSYQAFVVEEDGSGAFEGAIKQKTIRDLPDGDVLVRVQFSSLNYKDALSATGNKGVTRSYPHTPGIDAAGIIEESLTEGLTPGDAVIVTSYDLGMNTDGGFGQYIRVPADWVVKRPPGLSPKESMIFGTAGFTAGMSVHRLTETIHPGDGEILVTGATGGVGSIAAGILSKQGYRVTALSGKPDAMSFLEKLGVQTVITRDSLLEGSNRPILKTRFDGVIDAVGGNILAAAIKSVKPLGVVTCCGNVASPDLPINVFPFILRGVSLIGIDSQNCPMKWRRQIWEKLAAEWKIDALEAISSEIGLDGLNDAVAGILKGQRTGRTVVNLD